jgi:integrase
MPIINYEQKAEQCEQNFFDNRRISQKNKTYVKKFLSNYTVKKGDRKGLPVSPTRKSIFLRHIPFLIERTDDIKRDMQSQDKIDGIFRDIKKTKIKWRGEIKPLSDCYYGTIINVSLTFATWLNDGVRPKGFKNIQHLSRKALRRKLNPDDMITWEEIEEVARTSHSVQLKAIATTALDGGLRPSEFVDLNYGDVKIKKDFIVLYVRAGKGGKDRFVTLWRAVPYLLKWYQAHPTKRKNDPLWVQEERTADRIIRYKYPAIQKRIRVMFVKAKIDKPSDFYNLRHSAVYLSKKDNVPPELAAEKFGHTVEYYINTYGRLDEDDVLDRYSKHYGIKEQKEEVEQNVKCNFCDNIEPPGMEICSKCGKPTTLGKALELKTNTENKLNELNERFARMERRQKIVSKSYERKINIFNREEAKELIRDMFKSGEFNLKDHIDKK